MAAPHGGAQLSVLVEAEGTARTTRESLPFPDLGERVDGHSGNLPAVRKGLSIYMRLCINTSDAAASVRRNVAGAHR